MVIVICSWTALALLVVLHFQLSMNAPACPHLQAKDAELTLVHSQLREKVDMAACAESELAASNADRQLQLEAKATMEANLKALQAQASDLSDTAHQATQVMRTCTRMYYVPGSSAHITGAVKLLLETLQGKTCREVARN